MYTLWGCQKREKKFDFEKKNFPIFWFLTNNFPVKKFREKFAKMKFLKKFREIFAKMKLRNDRHEK